MFGLEQVIATHPATDILVAGVIGTAFAGSLPEQRPKTLDDLWTWFSDFVHALASTRRPLGLKG